MKRPALLVFALAACAPPSAPRDPAQYACPLEATSTLSGPRADALEQVMNDGARRFPGLIAAAVTPDGRWFSSRGFADLDARAPMQPCTRMRIGSVTKTFVALATLRLVDRGLLELDAPAADHLPPEVVKGVANADRATLRQLLSHTSGVPNGLDDPGIALSSLFDDPSRPRSPRDSLAAVRGLPPAFSPGDGWGYSNSNFELVGLILEAVSGRPLAEVLHQEVIAPLGLTSSAHRESDGPAPARGYLDPHGTRTFIDSSSFTTGVDSAAGGIVSTAADLVRLLEAVRSEPRLSAWVEVPTEKAVAPNHTGYGLGLMRWHTPHGDALGHGGELFGWQAWAFTFPARGITWVALANADFGQANDDFHQLQDAALTALFE